MSIAIAQTATPYPATPPLPRPLLFLPEEGAGYAPPAAPIFSTNHPDPAALTVNSLIYFSSDNWVFWLNGQKITPVTMPAGVVVTSISADEINLSINGVSYLLTP